MENIENEKVSKPNFVLTVEDFLFLKKEILEMGYREMNQYDSRKSFLRLNLSPPRNIIGREVSFYYNHNGYTVILHTTYLEKEKKWRDTGTDVGWNLISHGDKAVYFAKPFLRTKSFILKFLKYAYISKWKVDNRPLCPECKAFMVIFRKTGSRQYFWSCFNKTRHESQKPQYLSWDYGLPQDDIKFVSIRREYTRNYHKKNKKEGKTPIPAAVKRKKWIVGNKDNLLF